MRILRGAGQSGMSLQRKLEQRGYTTEAATEAVERCIATGYVNDAAMAASVAARHRRAGHGRARVAADLKSKGVAADLITEALDGQSDTEEALRTRSRAATLGCVPGLWILATGGRTCASPAHCSAEGFRRRWSRG